VLLSAKAGGFAEWGTIRVGRAIVSFVSAASERSAFDIADDTLALAFQKRSVPEANRRAL